MGIKYSVLRLKKCKYETPCVGYDTQVTVKACVPLVKNYSTDEKKSHFPMRPIIILCTTTMDGLLQAEYCKGLVLVYLRVPTPREKHFY